MANAPVIDIATGLPMEECVHELIARYCSLCKPKPQNRIANQRVWQSFSADAQRPEDISGPKTEAQFSGHCPSCDWEIEVGDMIGLRHGEWVCAQCAHDADIEASKQQHPSHSQGGTDVTTTR